MGFGLSLSSPHRSVRHFEFASRGDEVVRNAQPRRRTRRERPSECNNTRRAYQANQANQAAVLATTRLLFGNGKLVRLGRLQRHQFSSCSELNSAHAGRGQFPASTPFYSANASNVGD